MSINIVNQLVENLHLAPLQKIDPTTEKVVDHNTENTESALTQAIVPTVVAGIYDSAKSEVGLAVLASDATSSDWLTLLFGEQAPTLKARLAAYTATTETIAEKVFDTVAKEAVAILRNAAKGNDMRTAIRDIAGAQKPFFMSYLPTSLHVGQLLGDTSLDDSTNKMEGPVSSFLHKLESALSGNESKDAADEKKDQRM
ncbi:hypothetical protein ACFOWM_08965 [Ferruginibacter yonginensis]|uniref:Uncharacterized protein n=1 Tax=Ferruginibacter yonginensis TaxID=1310416 RepID=A0ABV8QT16_9BACT